MTHPAPIRRQRMREGSEWPSEAHASGPIAPGWPPDPSSPWERPFRPPAERVKRARRAGEFHLLDLLCRDDTLG